jgi:hypothetical protein
MEVQEDFGKTLRVSLGDPGTQIKNQAAQFRPPFWPIKHPNNVKAGHASPGT